MLCLFAILLLIHFIPDLIQSVSERISYVFLLLGFLIFLYNGFESFCEDWRGVDCSYSRFLPPQFAPVSEVISLDLRCDFSGIDVGNQAE